MRFFIVGLLFLVPDILTAGIYSPDDAFLFELEPGLIAKPIQYSGGFDSILADYRDINVPGSRLHQQLMDRIQRRRAEGVNRLNPVELAGYTADLIRVNRADEVLNLLHPIARDPRKGGFLVYTHLARSHASRGDGWREAAEQQLMAVKYSEFPSQFGKLTRDQLAWLKKVETDYYLPFLLKRAEEARGGRSTLQNETPDRLFPAKSKRDAEYVNYEPTPGSFVAGKIAEAEQAKLPPDAIAIIQQMLLWHPNDPRLTWQLGELYNAEGDIDSAAKILDLCSYTQGYSNPQLLEHRRVLQSAVSEVASRKQADQDRLRQEAELEAANRQQQKIEDQKRFWWIVSIATAGGLLLLYFQVRELRRRVRRWFS